MIYLFGWFLSFFASILNLASFSKGKIFGFFIILFLALISFFRGAVGTDTIAYEWMFDGFKNNSEWDGIEIGFYLLANGLNLIFYDVQMAVRFIAVIYFSLILIFLIRSDRNERYFLVAYVIPVFCYMHSMNVLRIGLAFAVLMLVIQSVRINGEFSRFKYAFFGVLLHYSLFFSIGYIYLLSLNFRRWKSWLAMIVFFAVSAMAFIFLESYVNRKISLYQDYIAPSSLSGLAILIPLSIILISVSLGKLLFADKVKLISFGFSFLFVAWVISGISYAGLRILDLLMGAIPISVLMVYQRNKIDFDIKIKIGFLVAALLSAFASYRGFSLQQNDVLTPFLPYHFIWEAS